MDLTKRTVSERCHISFFGCRNAGKSSLVNAFTNQNISVVSDIKGTTTDPVKKTMELLPFGPVVIIDTPGFDDDGKLGELRVEKTTEILGKTDIAVLVADSAKELSTKDKELIELFKNNNIPYIIAFNKCDLLEKTPENKENVMYVSALTGENVWELKDLAGKYVGKFEANKEKKFIIIDKIEPEDTVILVIPIDESAPKGRLILPQQLTITELLENHNKVICVQDSELKCILDNLKSAPKLIITDSQAFEKIKDVVPKNVQLTSFSILFARYKGNLKRQIEGANALSKLKDGDRVLISEGCTHHRQCNDIGSVKFPKWLKNYTGADLIYEFTSGGEFPQDLSKYKLVIHCGGCMLNEQEMKTRVKRASEQGVPIVNYGVAIACMNGILERSLEILEH